MTRPQGSSTFTVLDTSGIRIAILRIILFDFVGFISFGLVLYAYCFFLEGFTCALLLFSTQLIIGMIVTRLHYSLGRLVRSKAKFIDPSKLDGWEIEHKEIDLEDLRTILQEGFTSIPEQNLENIDDYNDIAWFIILLWSLISSVLFYFVFSVPVFCITSIFIIVFVSLMTFYNGYQSGDFEDLRDDFKHLEFFVLSRLSKLHSIDNVTESSLFIEWISKDDIVALNDFGVNIKILQSDEDVCYIDYHIGFPSFAEERLELQGACSIDSDTIMQLKEQASESDWWLEIDSSANVEMISRASLSLHSISAIDLDDVEPASNQVLEFINLIINAYRTRKG